MFLTSKPCSVFSFCVPTLGSHHSPSYFIDDKVKNCSSELRIFAFRDIWVAYWFLKKSVTFEYWRWHHGDTVSINASTSLLPFFFSYYTRVRQTFCKILGGSNLWCIYHVTESSAVVGSITRIVPWYAVHCFILCEIWKLFWWTCRVTWFDNWSFTSLIWEITPPKYPKTFLNKMWSRSCSKRSYQKVQEI